MTAIKIENKVGLSFGGPNGRETFEFISWVLKEIGSTTAT
jgi:hypothetical protein